MSNINVQKLYTTLPFASKQMNAHYVEMPIIALRMLLYISIQTADGHTVFTSDLLKEFDTYPEKLHRNLRQHLKDYVICTTVPKEGIKKPVQTFQLNQKGIDYITKVVEELK